MAHLEIQSRSQGPQQVLLDPERGSKLTIGRHTTNVVTIDNDDLVSRFHCEILRTGDGYVLKDLDSRNGTITAGERITSVVLEPGDTFFVGRTRMVFVDDPEDDDPPEEAIAVGSELVEIVADSAGDGTPPSDGSALETPDLYEVAEDDRPSFDGSTYRIGSIDALATVGRDCGFDDSALALVNARGKVVHAAEDDNSATGASLRVLRLMLLGCTRAGASDIHVEPKRNSSLGRLRIDGAMVEIAQMDTEAAKRLFSLIKVLCDIDITKKEIVQEGHFSCRMPGRQVDYRVSYTPTMFGQKLVIRVLDPMNSPQMLRDLELPDWMYQKIRETVKQDTGMLLVCGPTGSGKTTTLYAALRQIDAKVRNVLTIEDPVEYEVAGVTQIPVDEDHGASFHSLLRSCLRQDPDVIVLGEIRDADTATTAMQAATTGHLVLSTTHAKDTIGTVYRLLDLGCEPYLVASTLNLVLAQRLVRVLCSSCKLKKRATPEQIRRIGRTVEGVTQLFAPSGCPNCFGTGYTGRSAIFELLAATDELRDVILNSPGIADIKKAIEMSMFTSLRDSAYSMAMAGETSMEEVARVVGVE